MHAPSLLTFSVKCVLMSGSPAGGFPREGERYGKKEMEDLMVTFTKFSFVLLVVCVSVALAGCEQVCGDGVCDPEEMGYCDADCGDNPEPVCGDGVCGSGEAQFSCPEDCTVDPAGTSEPMGSGIDGSCFQHPDNPVNCGDASCWPRGTDCNDPQFWCAGNYYRCNSEEGFANCGKDGAFVVCPSDYPFYCVINGLCYTPEAFSATECSDGMPPTFNIFGGEPCSGD